MTTLIFNSGKEIEITGETIPQVIDQLTEIELVRKVYSGDIIEGIATHIIMTDPNEFFMENPWSMDWLNQFNHN